MTNTVAKNDPNNNQKNNSKVLKIDFGKLYEYDGYLKSYENEISRRFSVFSNIVNSINDRERGLENFATSFQKYGVQVRNNSIYWLEWIPGAEAVYLAGKELIYNLDFNFY